MFTQEKYGIHKGSLEISEEEQILAMQLNSNLTNDMVLIVPLTVI